MLRHFNFEASAFGINSLAEGETMGLHSVGWQDGHPWLGVVRTHEGPASGRSSRCQFPCQRKGNYQARRLCPVTGRVVTYKPKVRST